MKDLPPSASSAPQTWRLLIEEDAEDGFDGDGDGLDGDGGGDGLDGDSGGDGDRVGD